MTPHAKAHNLVMNFFKINPIYRFGTGDNNYTHAKKYASILVDTVMRLRSDKTSYRDEDGELHNFHEFWTNVKQEIETI